MHQFLYLINGYLLFSCLEQVFKEEKKGNRKKKILEVLPKAGDGRNKTGK